MPVKSNIELGSGQIYFKGMDESLEVLEGSITEATEDIEWADDQEPVIKFSSEPTEITIDNVEFGKDWTMVKCCKCGYDFPITMRYFLIYGAHGWACPVCAAAFSRQEH